MVRFFIVTVWWLIVLFAACRVFQAVVSCWRCLQCLSMRRCASCTCCAVHLTECTCSSQPPARREILKCMLCVLNTRAGVSWSHGWQFLGSIMVRTCVHWTVVLWHNTVGHSLYYFKSTCLPTGTLIITFFQIEVLHGWLCKPWLE